MFYIKKVYSAIPGNIFVYHESDQEIMQGEKMKSLD